MWPAAHLRAMEQAAGYGIEGGDGGRGDERAIGAAAAAAERDMEHAHDEDLQRLASSAKN